MIVVADSSPLQYLILLDQSNLLQHLYGQVFVPDIVAVELRAQGAPDSVRQWMSHPPAWLDVMATTAAELMSVSESLDRGERSAIALAERLRAELILIDEKDGRNEALQRRFQVTGTLGVLRAAAERGLIDVRTVLARLRTTTFYMDDALVDKMFERWPR